ncbi:hypothetical protein ZOD2009_16818 [Haladaptatus paucihalophilus DX253]|uniref:Uncharacterized protein n=1 Tax=Haladaptatus paucihalophilus DX253 TaxID=797209 RepID=E7QX25_HALPU|nr:hypothetical protein [Haladaptatus paucihalophilus]EFW90828.1 hypothetical protein ZOD2009_16818 [Haladaptatus paucihalophilus DX253]SHK23257.1 hypothetical protein SAMN05444342_1042 [Haladaptatus paucihalophilus DX253]
MSNTSVRETVSTLRESREAIHEGRIAIAEARVELRARYDRAQRRIDDIDRALDLLQEEGPETDLRELFGLLDSDGASPERAVGDRPDGEVGEVPAIPSR